MKLTLDLSKLPIDLRWRIYQQGDTYGKKATIDFSLNNLELTFENKKELSSFLSYLLFFLRYEEQRLKDCYVSDLLFDAYKQVWNQTTTLAFHPKYGLYLK